MKRAREDRVYKTIQELVVGEVIHHMEYRDAEIQELNGALQKYGIKRCEHCRYFSNVFKTCDICIKTYCGELCPIVSEYNVWILDYRYSVKKRLCALCARQVDEGTIKL